MQKIQDEYGGKLLKSLVSIIISAVTGLLVCVIILLIGALAVSGGKLSEKAMLQFVLATGFIGSLIGGLYAARKVKRKMLICGAASGMIMYLFLLLLGMALDLYTGYSGVTLPVINISGGVLGGILASGKKTKKRKK